MEPKRRHNAVIALGILLAGFPIRFKDDDTEYYYQDGIFGFKGIKQGPINAGSGEELLFQCDLSLQDFIKLCEKMTFEELFIKSSEMVLTLWNRKERVRKANP